MAEQEFLSVSWFEYILGGLSMGFLGVLTMFWARLGRMESNHFNLEKAHLQQGARLDQQIAQQNERFQQQLQTALTMFAAADVTNDELRNQSLADRLEALKDDFDEFAKTMKENHLENKDEMHRLEERLNDNLNERRDMIEKTMREGFIQAVAAMRERKS